MTFFICCSRGKSGNQTLDYIGRVSTTATACNYITASFQIITIWPHCRATLLAATDVYATNVATVEDAGAGIGDVAFSLAMLVCILCCRACHLVLLSFCAPLLPCVVRAHLLSFARLSSHASSRPKSLSASLLSLGLHVCVSHHS